MPCGRVEPSLSSSDRCGWQIIQRFGAALNLNVHIHALVLDGVYAEDGSGTLRFHPTMPPKDEDMEALLAAIERRLLRLLARRGVVDGGDHGPDRWSEEAPVLAGMADASVQGRVAFGSRAGAEVRRCGNSPDLLALSSSVHGPCHAHQNGFDLHAAVVVPGRDRARLERVCPDPTSIGASFVVDLTPCSQPYRRLMNRLCLLVWLTRALRGPIIRAVSWGAHIYAVLGG